MRNVLVLALLSMMAFAGCLNNDDTGTDPWEFDGTDEQHWTQPNSGLLPSTISGMEYLTTGSPNGTLGLWFNDDLAYLSGGVGLRIVDISDPVNPVLVRDNVPDTQGSKDVDLIFHPNGRLYAAVTISDARMVLVDVTEPTKAEVVSQTDFCSHNVAVVPGTTIVYNSKSLCSSQGQIGGNHLELVDFADPTAPRSQVITFPDVVVTEGGLPRPITAISCHDVSFDMSRDRAFCAAITQTLVFDITDPWDPQIIQVIDWPGTNIHHAAWPARGGDLLILGDEMAGVIAPTPTCSDDVDIPTSALWFFDISDLSTPTPVGYFQAQHYDAIQASIERIPDRLTAQQLPTPIYCSTHFGTLIEDRDLFVLGWYTAGTVLLDFSDETNPVQVAHWDPEDSGSVWEARYYQGHVYTGDSARGMDILQII